jgi:serine/threonine protein phosphatase PrpC
VFNVESAAFTHQGNVRSHNEDACVDVGERNLWVVADGMGGHEQGDYASQKIVESLREVPDLDRPSEKVDLVENRLVKVNAHLFERSRAGEQPVVIGSTVVALTVFDRFGLTIWAGDSRAYRLRDGKLDRVSRDHSEVQTLIDQGLVAEEDAESHPQANVITRAVGGMEELYLDYELRELEAGDRYLLCSDGLYKDLTDEEIRERLCSGNCRESAMDLLNTALSRECSDNVTVLVVDFLSGTDSSGLADDSAGSEAEQA